MESLRLFCDEYGVRPWRVLGMTAILTSLVFLGYNVAIGLSVASGHPVDYIPYLHGPLKWFVDVVG